MTVRPLLVSEVFGPTFQGEGPSAGVPAAFVRLGLCNLDCSWCDTPYTWDWTGKNGPPADRSALVHREWRDVAAEVLAMGVPLAVLTGGEPMLQQAGLAALVEALHYGGMHVEVETNGTRLPTEQALMDHVRFNVSPKLSGSGVARADAIKPAVLATYGYLGARFKFVATGTADVVEAHQLVTEAGIRPEQVWIMPEGRSAGAIVDGLRTIADTVLGYGYQLGGRLHVLLWEDERGR